MSLFASRERSDDASWAATALREYGTGGQVDGSSYVLGESDQLVHMELAAGESVLSTPGSMLMMSTDITSSVDCSKAISRCLAGEFCIMSQFTNTGRSPGFLSLTARAPSKVIPLVLDRGDVVHARSGSFLAQRGPVELGYECDCNPLTSCCSGQGCIYQSLSGSGTAFVSATGTITMKQLQKGERLIVDTTSLLAWQSTVTLGVKPSGGCCVCCLGGEGCFNTTVTGPGNVYLQSMNYQKMRNALLVRVDNRRPAAATVTEAN